MAGFFIRACYNVGMKLMRLMLSAAFAIGIPLAVYFSAYLLLSTRGVYPDSECRYYQNAWLCDLFYPATKVESYLRQEKMERGYDSPELKYVEFNSNPTH